MDTPTILRRRIPWAAPLAASAGLLLFGPGCGGQAEDGASPPAAEDEARDAGGNEHPNDAPDHPGG